MKTGLMARPGLAWNVVESLPVSEDIKRQTGPWRDHVATWIESMRNVAAAGIEIICYNFMPVLDWTRTDLDWALSGGATCMRFELIDFAAFDLHILKREGADFTPEVTEAAGKRAAELTDQQKADLTRNIVFGLPGAADNMTLDDVKAHLAAYDRISPDDCARI